MTRELGGQKTSSFHGTLNTLSFFILMSKTSWSGYYSRLKIKKINLAMGIGGGRGSDRDAWNLDMTDEVSGFVRNWRLNVGGIGGRGRSGGGILTFPGQRTEQQQCDRRSRAASEGKEWQLPTTSTTDQLIQPWSHHAAAPLHPPPCEVYVEKDSP